jgi:hypothetical protein
MSFLILLLFFDANNPDLKKSLSHGTDVAVVHEQNANNTTCCYEHLLTNTEENQGHFTPREL